MEQVLYDGVALTDWFDVVGVRRPTATPTPTYQYVNGGDRNAVRGVELVPPQITFRIVARELPRESRRESVRRLAAMLVKREPVDVEFSDDDGLRYSAVPDGPLDFQEFVQSGYLDVTLTCAEAFARGRTERVDATGASVSIEVGGTYPTALKVTASAAVRDSGSYLWGVRVDEGDFAYVEIGTSSASSVEIDSDTATAEVNGDAAQITLESDWLVVEPGEHVVRRDVGSGAFSVEWEERWL